MKERGNKGEMEEYKQITLDEWMQWKEDIRHKLAETAENFVHIGYRLKQIRDSGMYDGAMDIFEFAKKEYGLTKSTVSRFIAINEKYSEGGNSLELKEEFKKFSSSKLAEMLTLPDDEIQMITEKTTIREIRELKNFNAQDPELVGETEAAADQEWGPLEKCLIDYFKDRKEMLNSIMKHMEKDPPEYKQAAEAMAPSGQASHKKGIVFLFLYNWDMGVKYKIMTDPSPVSMTWSSLLEIVYGIYRQCNILDVWEDFYKTEAVVTSQQEKETADKEPESENQEEKESAADEAEIQEAADVAEKRKNTGSGTLKEAEKTVTAPETACKEVENVKNTQYEADRTELENQEVKGEEAAEPEETEDEDELPCEPDEVDYEERIEPVAAEPKHTDRIEQLRDEAAERADGISKSLKTAENLDEYRRIKLRVSGLKDILDQLIKEMNLAMPEEKEDEEEDEDDE